MNTASVRDAFGGLHPGPGYLFFGFVIVFSVVFLHPVVLAISFAGATGYAIYLTGAKAVRFTLALLVPVMLLAALLNPAFNHRGATILFYLWTGNPFTAESLLYGALGGLMLGTVVQWFYCYNAIMTADKFIWLFGRITPALSLVVCMVLRHVPHYKNQAMRIMSARQAMGIGAQNEAFGKRKIRISLQGCNVDKDGANNEAFGKRKILRAIISKVKDSFAVFGILTTWALENAIDTADSMTSRGYGTGKRTSYSDFRLVRRDIYALVFIATAAVICAATVASGAINVSYFPLFTMGVKGWAGLMMLLAWLAVCAFPLVFGLWEDAIWRSLKSKI
ncbi:MAG: energy-coupling factor transporter transmembrane protein EcfT [Coriobacteriales bacterium]|jgi:energy-coupling factor transport system permease protein|nr:energy-coupling factor transporter transmembrane protein EcfT [Coriobacteriales bacterium]